VTTTTIIIINEVHLHEQLTVSVSVYGDGLMMVVATT
jgi:hypothetical protein